MMLTWLSSGALQVSIMTTCDVTIYDKFGLMTDTLWWAFSDHPGLSRSEKCKFQTATKTSQLYIFVGCVHIYMRLYMYMGAIMSKSTLDWVVACRLIHTTLHSVDCCTNVTLVSNE